MVILFPINYEPLLEGQVVCNDYINGRFMIIKYSVNEMSIITRVQSHIYSGIIMRLIN